MPFELRLTFSGLTALVPRTEGNPGQGTEWLVVMPALSGGDILQLPTGGQSFPIAPHQAMLVINEQAVHSGPGGSSKLPFLRRFPPRKDSPSYLLYRLEQELLEIGSGATGLQVAPGSQAGELPNLAAPDQVHDLKWVPPMDGCLNMAVRFNKNLLDTQTLLPSQSLSGIVRLDRGVLETREVHTGLDEHKKTIVVPYKFQNIVSGTVRFRQALADGFHVRDIQVAEDTALLNLTDHQGNKSKIIVGPYKDCPTNENGQPLVEIQIFNEEMDKILGFSGRLNPQDADKGDTDFMIFYKLSTAWSALSSQDLVLPYLDLDHHGGGGGDSRPCEPPKFSGLGG